MAHKHINLKQKQRQQKTTTPQSIAHKQTYPNSDQEVVLLHLVDVRDANLIAFEGGLGQLSVDEIDISFKVGNDQISAPTRAC